MTLSDLIKAVRDIVVEHGFEYAKSKRVMAAVGCSAPTYYGVIAMNGLNGTKGLVEASKQQAIRDDDAAMLARMYQAGYHEFQRAKSVHPNLAWPPAKSKIFMAAADMVREHGLNVHRKLITDLAGCCFMSLCNEFGSMKNMPDELMVYAIEMEDAKLLMRGLQVGNDIAKKAPKPLRDHAIKLMVE